MNKDELVVDLEQRTNALFWIGIGFGLLSVAILGYAAASNWNRWMEWRHRRQTQQASDAADSVALSPIEAQEEDVGEIPVGQLCVICLMRRRRSAFIPCGHLVCCYVCSTEHVHQPSIPFAGRKSAPQCKYTIHDDVQFLPQGKHVRKRICEYLGLHGVVFSRGFD